MDLRIGARFTKIRALAPFDAAEACFLQNTSFRKAYNKQMACKLRSYKLDTKQVGGTHGWTPNKIVGRPHQLDTKQGWASQS